VSKASDGREKRVPTAGGTRLSGIPVILSLGYKVGMQREDER
jgi:hypothetical protein